MQAVFDTNVLVSALLWHGPPHVLLEQVRNGSIALITSPALLAELADVIGRAKFDAILTRTNTSRERALAQEKWSDESEQCDKWKLWQIRPRLSPAAFPSAKLRWYGSGARRRTPAGRVSPRWVCGCRPPPPW